MHSWHAYPQLSMLYSHRKNPPNHLEEVSPIIPINSMGKSRCRPFGQAALRCCMYFPFTGLFPVSCKSNISMIMQDSIVHFMEFYCCQFCTWFCQVYLRHLSINKRINQLLIHSFIQSICPHLHTHTRIRKERTSKNVQRL